MKKTRVDEYVQRDVFDYPGRRHEGNFVSDGVTIFEAPADPQAAIAFMNRYLVEKGLMTIDERIPVLAYGRNASPAAFQAKMNVYATDGDTAENTELQTVPYIEAFVHGSDVVWHGKPSRVGSYFSELYTGDEVKDAKVSAFVQFLTPAQLALLHTSEGATYGVTEQHEVELLDGTVFDAVSYSAHQGSVLLDENGQPIRVDGLNRQPLLPSMTAREAASFTLATREVRDVTGIQNPEEYVAYIATRHPSEQSKIQNSVFAALKKAKKTREYRHPSVATDNLGRANFSNLPRGVQRHHSSSEGLELMEQSLASLKEKGRRGAIEKIRRQATDELLDPRRAEDLRYRMSGLNSTHNV